MMREVCTRSAQRAAAAAHCGRRCDSPERAVATDAASESVEGSGWRERWGVWCRLALPLASRPSKNLRKEIGS